MKTEDFKMLYNNSRKRERKMMFQLLEIEKLKKLKKTLIWHK